MHHAAEASAEHVKILLARGFRADPTSLDGRSALSIAALSGRHDTMTALAGAGYDLDKRRNEGRSALSLAVEFGKDDSVRTLLGLGADPDHEDDCSMTPLLIALAADKTPIAQLLLGAGADPRRMSKNGMSPLFPPKWAARFDGTILAKRTATSADSRDELAEWVGEPGAAKARPRRSL